MMEKQIQPDRVILAKTGVQRAHIGQLCSIFSAQIIIFAEIQDRFRKFSVFTFDIRWNEEIPKRS